MKSEYVAPGLTGSWLNGWLAAIGITVLVPEIRLRWSDDDEPCAVFDSADLIDRLVAALPTIEDLHLLAIANVNPLSSHAFPRNPTLEAYCDRCRVARERSDFSLSSTITDFTGPDSDRLEHSPFDPSAPKGITIHERLVSCLEAIDDPTTMVAASLAGRARRQQLNGLGFDYRRILAPTVPRANVYVDPIVELLAFYGMALIPVRGDMRRTRARGWTKSSMKRGAFTWPVWMPWIGTAGIDALLDLYWSGGTTGMHVAYSVVPYQQRSTMDSTRGFASERLS